MTKTIAFVVFPGFQLLDAAGPLAAFEIAARYEPGAYDLRVVGPQAGAIASSSGAALVARAPWTRPRVHTVIVAGGDGTRQPLAPALARFLVAAERHAERMASVCSGAYLLAALGMLDGRRATTHWQRSADFARKFPAVRLEPDRIFVRDGKVWTSAGITAGIDLALALVAEDLGEDVARLTAQELVVYYQRPGGQSQFSALLELERPDARFGELLGWAREHLGGDLGVDARAARVGMSPRNFTRVFTRETGATPARAIERMRVEAARDRVEATDDAIEAIAARYGFGDAERMRRAFVRAFGQPPQAVRRVERAAIATASARRPRRALAVVRRHAYDR